MVDMREAQNVRCTTTLAGFDHPEGWCYIGCTNDQTELKQIGNRFKCENAIYGSMNQHTVSGWLHLLLMRQKVDIILFDKQAHPLCGYSATKLVMQPDTTRQEVPFAFAPAVGRKYNFVLKYNRGTEQNKRPTFNVNDIMPITTTCLTTENSRLGSGSSAATSWMAGTVGSQPSGSQSNLPPKTPSNSTDSRKNDSSRGNAIA